MDQEFNKIVVHFEEISLKGKNQGFFISKLIENIKQITLANINRGGSKLIINDYSEQLLDQLTLMPGLANVAPAISTSSELENIKQAALKVFFQVKPITFKISTSRAFKDFSLNSNEVSREVGAYVLENRGEVETSVDVKKPELEIRVSIEKDQTYVLGPKHKGLGGLPVGTAGKVLCLLSGGIDSPVAASMMMKRGAKVEFIHFHNQTINQKGVEQKIFQLVTQLENIQGKSKVHIVPFADLQKQVIANVPADQRMIIYRRLMYRIAEQIALKNKCGALVTGDSLSQVASQTLGNMNVIYNATSMLKLAPLVGMNKLEVTNIAKKINTYEISILPYEDCCSLMIAKHPETRGDLEKIKQIESGFDLDELIQSAVDQTNTK
jgi:tRNA uracil 4-sulfurtransferase